MALKKTRLGRCYELAAKHMYEHAVTDMPEATLVHGTIGPNENPHAWVEWTETIDIQGREFVILMAWEPVSEDALPYDAFEHLFYAKPYAKYSRMVAAQWMAETKHYGPWEGEYWKVVKSGRKRKVEGA